MAVLGTLAFSAPAAQAAAQWYDGNVSRSYITNCASIIFPPAYTEEGAWNWVGFWADANNLPNPGEVFYVHTVIGAVGNACSGQRTYPSLSLPSGVSPAISAQTPVYCWAIDFQQGTSSQEGPACPQAAYTGSYGGQWAIPALTQSQNAYTWPLPQGKGWEFWYPVVSNRQLSGTLANPCDCVIGYTKVLDGNSSPVLQPDAGLVIDPASAPTGGGGAPGDTTGTSPPIGSNPGGGSGQGGSGQGGGAGGQTSVPPPVFSSFTAPSTYSLARLRSRGLSVSALVGRAGSRVDAILSGSPRGRGVSAKRIVLAKATKKNAAAGKVTLKLRLTRAGKSALRKVRRGSARLRITVTPPGAAKASKTKKIRLRR